MYSSLIHYCHRWLHAGSGYACCALCEMLCLMTYHLPSTIVCPLLTPSPLELNLPLCTSLLPVSSRLVNHKDEQAYLLSRH